MRETLLLLILAVVQGLTEFLPVSSSGHLVIVAEIWSSLTGQALPNQLTLNVLLHAATLLAILVYYRRRVFDLLSKDRSVVASLVVGTIPAACAGLVLKSRFPTLLESSFVAGVMLLVTAALLLLARRLATGDRRYVQLSWSAALLIGIFQAAALLPGISRSGATIFAGLAVGLRRDEAATFAFLLAIPAITGAMILELPDLADAGTILPTAKLALAFVVAFLVGLAAIVWLVRWLEAGKLHYFAIWCAVAGIAVIAWQVV